MESNSICKICNKGFANRKALGGHMRSHLAKLPLPSKPFIQSICSLDRSSSSSDSESEVVPDATDFSTLSHDAKLINEAKSSELICSPLRRTKRRCRRAFEKAVTSVSPEQVSSPLVLDSTSVYEAAATLMMIAEEVTNPRKRKFEYNIDFDDVISEYDEDEDEDESYTVTNQVGSKAPKSRYKCELCNRLFLSPQALGGHKGSHRKILKKAQINEEEGMGSSSMNQRKFKCSFCGKEFDSGQALGGHKRVHLAHQGSTNTADVNVSKQYPILSLSYPCFLDDHEANTAQSEGELSDLNLAVPELLDEHAN